LNQNQAGGQAGKGRFKREKRERRAGTAIGKRKRRGKQCSQVKKISDLS